MQSLLGQFDGDFFRVELYSDWYKFIEFKTQNNNVKKNVLRIGVHAFDASFNDYSASLLNLTHVLENGRVGSAAKRVFERGKQLLAERDIEFPQKPLGYPVLEDLYCEMSKREEIELQSSGEITGIIVRSRKQLSPPSLDTIYMLRPDMVVSQNAAEPDEQPCFAQLVSAAQVPGFDGPVRFFYSEGIALWPHQQSGDGCIITLLPGSEKRVVRSSLEEMLLVKKLMHDPPSNTDDPPYDVQYLETS